MIFQRLAVLIGLMLLMTVAMQGCAPGYNFALHLQEVGGKPYMLVEYSSATTSERGDTFFSIFTPKNENWDDWEPIATDRLGRAYAMYVAGPENAVTPEATTANPVAPANPVEKTSAPPPGERLGVFHDRRATLFDISKRPATQSFDMLPFEWFAETAVLYNGTTYAFGVTHGVYDSAKHEGRLKAARFDGKKWEELKIEGPAVKGNKYGFWMDTLATPEGIRLFWRDYDTDIVIQPGLEGPRMVTDGPLMSVVFANDAFSTSTVQIANLPRGNASPWLDGDTIKLLMQTRHKSEDAIFNNGPMEIWKVTPAGLAEKIETIEASRQKGGLLAYLTAEHLKMDGREYIVRSNLQVFEVWKKTDATWAKVAYKPKGLPVYDLESTLLTSLGVALGMVAFGVGLAYRRRKQALTLLTKIKSRDIYASLGLRMGAYAVDLCVIIGVTVLIGRWKSWAFVSPIEMLNFFGEPYWPFFAVYMVYLSTLEKMFGSTAGKFIMGLSVVLDGGKKLTVWAALVRNFTGFFERLPPVFVLVTIWMIILGPRRQRMGDLVSRTFVVQKGAFEAFKRQRTQELALLENAESGAKIPELDVLPPADPWEGESTGKGDKGRRS